MRPGGRGCCSLLQAPPLHLAHLLSTKNPGMSLFHIHPPSRIKGRHRRANVFCSGNNMPDLVCMINPALESTRGAGRGKKTKKTEMMKRIERTARLRSRESEDSTTPFRGAKNITCIFVGGYPTQGFPPSLPLHADYNTRLCSLDSSFCLSMCQAPRLPTTGHLNPACQL